VQIAFGSDGFRGIIGHRMTAEAVARITRGAIRFLEARDTAGPTAAIPVGYDTRFMARRFAAQAGQILEQAGLKPRLAGAPCPSPYLAFAVRRLKAPLGLQLTASHNPPLYGGLKLKGAHGGSLFPADADLIESLANEESAGAVTGATIQDEDLPVLDVAKDYRKALLKAAGWPGDKEQPLIVDFMHGAAAGLYGEVLAEAFDLDEVLRAEPDPYFGGAKPEPVAGGLDLLQERVPYEGGGTIGLAFDGDGDRLGVVDERGRLLESHEIFCLLLEHLVKHHERTGDVVVTVSFSGLTRRVAEAHGCRVHEVPVGFKHVSRAMVELDAVMGGEESGGTGFGHFLPERDALLMALTLLHARQLADVPLSEMVEQLYATYGRPVFIHRDVPLPADADREQLRGRMEQLAGLSKLAGESVEDASTFDGVKLRTASGWVLTRLSGTEPLARIYAEGESEQQAGAYADAAQEQLKLG